MNVVKDVAIKDVENELNIDKKVLQCYYNICKYYNKDTTLIMLYLKK